MTNAPKAKRKKVRETLRNEWLAILVLALAAGGAWLFIEIADEVIAGQTHGIDEKLLLALRSKDDHKDPIGPDIVEQMARDITALGSVTALTLLTGGVAGFLFLLERRRAALLVLLAVSSGFAGSKLLKAGFERPRPDSAPPEMYVSQHSFPSGHAMHATVTYLTLGTLLIGVQRRKRIKAYVLAAAIGLTLLIGVSRVYLGVHWPTDVLAGWAAGATWALLWWLLARYLQRRGEALPAGDSSHTKAKS